jgi:hypothetical protein
MLSPNPCAKRRRSSSTAKAWAPRRILTVLHGSMLSPCYCQDPCPAWDRRKHATQPRALAADGVFADDILNEEGLAFAQAYFEFKTGNYLKDYDKLLSAGLPSMYHVPDTWESYDAIKPQIDKRYRAWQKKRRSK